jgi:16S rRNA processing protein RimM
MSTSNSWTDPEDPGSPRLLEVGRIAKPHGVRGEVVVVLTTDRSERDAPGTVLQTARGPLTVLASRPERERFLVTFEGLHDREDADEWRGTILLAEPIDDPDTLWIHELIGCHVRSQDGVDRGLVESVQANPASDLLVLDSGSLVPLHFVVGEPIDGVIAVDVPDGLFDL